MSSVNATIYFSEGDLPTGRINNEPLGGRNWPLIQLADGAVLAGMSGDFVPYLRRLAEVASDLADRLEAADAMAAEAVCNG